MTYEEAIAWLKFRKDYDGELNQEHDDNATALAIEALEKQIAKSPKEKYEYMGNIGYGLNPTEYIKGYICPTCGEWLEEGDHHCPCGQAIDWSEVE